MTFTKCRQIENNREGCLFMPYCQNCGAEVAGNFCPNCGAQAGSVAQTAPQFIIHKDANVKPIFSTLHLVIAGYLGNIFLITTLVMLGVGIAFAFNPEYTFAEKLIFPVLGVILVGITYLLYLPGIKSIRKYAPEGEAMKAFRSFFAKSVLFIFAWGVTMAGCLYIIGLFFKVWRFGMWAACPNANQYVVIVDGEKIPVTRYYDDLSGYGARGKYIFMDENGEYYRPPIK